MNGDFIQFSKVFCNIYITSLFYVLFVPALYLSGFVMTLQNNSIVSFYRFLPPENICPNGRKKATLPKEATNVLRNWLDNSPRPYPTRETKSALAELTGLTTMQASLKR